MNSKVWTMHKELTDFFARLSLILLPSQYTLVSGRVGITVCAGRFGLSR